MASVLSVDDAREYLRFTSAATESAELVQDLINSAERALAQRVGPLQPESVTQRVRGLSRALLLDTMPVLELTSVTPLGGTALNVDDLWADPLSGLVEMTSGGTFAARAYDVAYVAGRAECPEDLVLAIKELLRHFWQPQRGSGTRGPGPAPYVPGAAFTFPNRVLELIEPYLIPAVG